ARALIERDELIGEELEDVFLEAESVDPTLTQPFERKLLQFRTFSPLPEPKERAEWQPETASAASTPAASTGAAVATWEFAPGAESEEGWPEPPEGWFED